MRFKGMPGMHVVDAETNTPVGVFNGRGFLEVTDEELVERMKRVFTPAPVRQRKNKPARKGSEKDDGKRSV